MTLTRHLISGAVTLLALSCPERSMFSPFLSPFSPSIKRAFAPFALVADAEVGGLPHVANEAARLALLGLATDGSYQVIQDDTSTTYQYNGIGGVIQVSGAGTPSVNGYWTLRGIRNGKPFYNPLGESTNEAGPDRIFWDSATSQWQINFSDVIQYISEEDTPTPDSAATWVNTGGDLPAPAVDATDKQAIQGFIFSYGANNIEGTGLFTLRGLSNGWPYYNRLGAADIDSLLSIRRVDDKGTLTWQILSSSGAVIYSSTEDVTSPELVLVWIGENLPVPSPFTPGTYRDLITGVKVGSVIYKVDSTVNGRNFYAAIAGVNQLQWDGTQWTDGTHNGVGDTAFPWEADWSGSGVTVTRDDIAVPENWSEVP